MKNTMIKVKEIYFDTKPNRPKSETGLVLILEDGRVFRHQSTDFIVSFEEDLYKSDSL